MLEHDNPPDDWIELLEAARLESERLKKVIEGNF
jgi:hypothetical protein